MKKFTLKHEIDCSAEDFWEVFFNDDFNTKLFLEELSFPEYEVVEKTESDTKITRTVRGMPKMDAPKPLKKLLGDGFRYEESGTFDRSTKEWKFSMKPSTLASKLRNEGTVHVEPIGDNRCRRVAALLCEAKIFGIGGLFESFTEKEMTKGWNASAVFMNKWIGDNEPG